MPKKKTIKCGKVRSGCERDWVQCQECGWIGYYDYVPFSLSNPIMTLKCGHGASVSFREAARSLKFQDVLKVVNVELIESDGTVIATYRQRKKRKKKKVKGCSTHNSSSRSAN